MSKETLINLRDYLLGSLSYEDRMWLIDELDDTGKGLESYCPYTKEELNARLEEAEREFKNGEYLPADEAFKHIAQELGIKNEPQRQAV